MNKLVIVALCIIGAVLLMDSASAQRDGKLPPSVLTSPTRKGLVQQNGERRAFRHGLGLANGAAFAKADSPTPIPKILISPPKKD